MLALADLCKEVVAVLPKPLQKLYDNALLFLDEDSTHQDHYWATGIVRAIRQVYPDCGGSHTATANIAKEKQVAMSRKGSPSCQDPPLVRNHKCDSPICSVGSVVKEMRKEGEKCDSEEATSSLTNGVLPVQLLRPEPAAISICSSESKTSLPFTNEDRK